MVCTGLETSTTNRVKDDFLLARLHHQYQEFSVQTLGFLVDNEYVVLPSLIVYHMYQMYHMRFFIVLVLES